MTQKEPQTIHKIELIDSLIEEEYINNDEDTMPILQTVKYISIDKLDDYIAEYYDELYAVKLIKGTDTYMIILNKAL